MVAWTDDLNIDHRVSPGEAHQRLGLVERKHQVLRKAIELYLEDQKVEGFDGIRQALTYIMPQLNSQTTVAGYSPTQWVLAINLRYPGFCCRWRSHLSISPKAPRLKSPCTRETLP